MIASAQPDPDTSLTLRRTFHAERERVFRAWTEATTLRQWFCPVGFSVAAAEVDLRVGGSYRFTLKAPDGDPSIAFGTYREISPPERLVYTWRWEGGEMDDTLVTVEFHDLGGSTEVVLVHEMFPAAEVRDRHAEGWTGCLDHLEQVLPNLG